MRLLIALLLSCCASGALAQQTCKTVTTVARVCEKPDITPEPIPPVLFEEPAKNAGAHLPITDTVASWGGTARFIAPNGAGTKCTETEPCAKLSDAQNVASNGDPIIARGGVYTNAGNTWNGSAWSSEWFITKQGIKLVAYPGELPVFDGSQVLTSFTVEGSYKWAAYQPMPCSNGFGITFCTESGNDNLNGDNIGKLPDQAWIDGVALKQVTNKTELAAKKFWVDPQKRIYFMAADVTGEVRASKLGDWLSCSDAADVTIKGLQVRRYSGSPSRGSTTDIGAGCDRITLEDMKFEDTSNMALLFNGTSGNFVDDATVRHVTMVGNNWIALEPLYMMHPIFDGLDINNVDRFDEFSGSPGSGALKASRSWHGKFINSRVADNKSHGIWWDQSNYDWLLAGNTIVKNTGSCVFLEISDGYTLVNNYVDCAGSSAVKLAGLTGAALYNNTIIGGKDALGIYADGRSAPDCAINGIIKATGAACLGYSSDRWTVADPPRPPTMDWMTRLDKLQGNIIGYPTGVGYCGEKTPLCVLRINNPANLPLNSILHKADTARGIPQTESDCNVYAVETGSVLRHTHPTSNSVVGYADVAAWTSAMAGAAPYPELQLDVHSLSGGPELIALDGTPTDALDHDASACPFPTDPALNEHVPAGTKHYGVLWK